MHSFVDLQHVKELGEACSWYRVGLLCRFTLLGAAANTADAARNTGRAMPAGAPELHHTVGHLREHSCSWGCTAQPRLHTRRRYRQQQVDAPSYRHGGSAQLCTAWRSATQDLQPAARRVAARCSSTCRAEAATGFHHSRLAATPKPEGRRRLEVTVRYSAAACW